MPLSKLIQGYLGKVDGLNAIRLDRCLVHALFMNLMLHGCYA
jgi:hypothetical protein